LAEGSLTVALHGVHYRLKSVPGAQWLTGGRVRSPGCRLYSRKATSGRICQRVGSRRLCLACGGWGRRCRLSRQKATRRARPCHSHSACAGGAVLRQKMMFSGRMRRFAGTHLAPFAPSVRRNLPHSQVGRLMFARAYNYAITPSLSSSIADRLSLAELG
jgi:hypothetical protein